MVEICILIAAFFLAYSNGANDNFKGVSTLFGSGVTNYKTAIYWATITTLIGCIAAIFIAQGLLKNFSGKGLIPDDLLTNPSIAISVAAGAAVTVFIATNTGIPVSTTHAIVGGLVGTGIMAAGAAFNFNQLQDTFVLPLLLSPAIACVASILLYTIFTSIRKKLNIESDTELIIDKPVSGSTNITAPGIYLERHATHKYTGDIAGISAQKILDGLHFLSAGAVGFSRGLNDVPKIAGLLLLVSFLHINGMIILIAIFMALGGLLSAKKVGVTMSKKITAMNSGQGFTANIITALLVSTASINALPVSTTHVSVGSIFGIGIVNKKADYRTMAKIFSSWILTLPMAAVIAALTYLIIN